MVKEYKTTTAKREYAKAWRLANLTRIKEHRIKNRRKDYLKESYRKYGLAEDEYTELMSSQNGCCRTCEREFNWDDRESKPNIDHCHQSGKVRGLLCKRCNSILGLVDDSKQILINLSEYL